MAGPQHLAAARRPQRRPGAICLGAIALALAGCGGSSRTYESDPQALLREAKAAVDGSGALHFKLASDGATATGSTIVIKDGEGDAKRPDGFTGSFDVVRSGFALSLKVVSTGGTFYVQLPFTTGFARTDPSSYGFTDPGRLISPDVGLSSLLSSTHSASLGDRDRLGGEELYELDVTLPGQKVKDLLTSADPAPDVKGRIGINVDSHQVRRVVLTGPFFEKGKDATFTLMLTDYGESVSVTPPAA